MIRLLLHYGSDPTLKSITEQKLASEMNDWPVLRNFTAFFAGKIATVTTLIQFSLWNSPSWSHFNLPRWHSKPLTRCNIGFITPQRCSQSHSIWLVTFLAATHCCLRIARTTKRTAWLRLVGCNIWNWRTTDTCTQSNQCLIAYLTSIQTIISCRCKQLYQKVMEQNQTTVKVNGSLSAWKSFLLYLYTDHLEVELAVHSRLF